MSAINIYETPNGVGAVSGYHILSLDRAPEKYVNKGQMLYPSGDTDALLGYWKAGNPN
jgi:hypothetical protein